MYLLGIDIGGTTIKCGLISPDGQLIDKWEIKTDITDNGKNILRDIAESIKSYLIKKEISLKEIKGIGLGIPGAVKENFTIFCPNIGWRNVQIDEAFKKELGIDILVKANNDANVAAAGELWKSSKEYKNLVLITLGTGVGGGIIIDGKIIEGSTGAGGEIGHIFIDSKHNYQCTCGLTGCLETVASATGIVRLAKEYLIDYPNSILTKIKDLSTKDIMDAVKVNDELGLKVLNETSMYIAKALSIISVTVNPEVFIIGGGVSNAGDILIEYIKKYYQQFAHLAVKNTKIEIAQLKNDAGIFGAAYLVK